MTNDLTKAGMNVEEVIPKEGVTGWSDSWMLSDQGEAPDLCLQVDELRRPTWPPR